MENRKIRWGLLGAGMILDRWMKGARMVEDMEIVSIASRTLESARKMAEKYQIPEATTYEGLLARDDIDVVYIPVPHPFHKELAIKAMKAGKHVLVEKPAGVNASEWEEMVDCARETGVFLMEAFWTRCFPMMDTIRDCIQAGKIGDLRLLQLYFSYRMGDDYWGRAFDPAAAGGGLLDVGVYDLHFVDAVLGKEPVSLHGAAAINTDELHLQVDEQAAYIASYDRGELALMASGVRTDLPETAFLYGTKGSIEVPHFYKPSEITIRAGGREEVISQPVPCHKGFPQDEGYQYEIRHVHDCLRAGLQESPKVTWNDTLRILRQCDSLRKEWNLKYPFEK